MKHTLTISAIFFYIFSFAQPEKDQQYYKSKYPGENAVEILCKQNIDIKIKKGKPVITYEKYVEKILLTDVVSAFATEKVYYSSYDSLISIEAYALIPNGNKYKKVKVNDFTYSFDPSHSVFYDDSRVCKFVYPSLVKGSKMVYIIKKEIKNPYYMPTLFFAVLRAMDRSEITITYDNLIEIAYNEVGTSSGKIKKEIEKGGKATTLKLMMDSIPSLNFEENVNNYRAYIPHILLRILNYKPDRNSKPVPILPSLDYLNKLYQSNICNINKINEPELKEVADSLVANASTEFEKVKNIYYWVQHNIRYIAFEDGDNGFVPMDAALVFRKRYGDCKGMANIMHAMLEKVGIKSYLTWVGTTDLPYKYTEIPSTFVDNHMILCYFDNNNNPYILDATAEFQSIEFAPVSIQGKECLVSIDSNTYKIINIPYNVLEVSEKSQMELDGNSLKIQTKSDYIGNAKHLYAYLNAHKTETEKRKYFGAELASEGQANSLVNNLKHTNLYAVDDTLTFWYDYTLSNYALVNKDKMYVKLFLRNLSIEPIDITKRRLPFEQESKQNYAWEQIFTIPQGYEVLYIPENISYAHPLFACHAQITHTGNQLIIKANYRTDFITLPSGDYEKWNEMNTQIRQFITQSIVLKKK